MSEIFGPPVSMVDAADRMRLRLGVPTIWRPADPLPECERHSIALGYHIETEARLVLSRDARVAATGGSAGLCLSLSFMGRDQSPKPWAPDVARRWLDAFFGAAVDLIWERRLSPHHATPIVSWYYLLPTWADWEPLRSRYIDESALRAGDFRPFSEALSLPMVEGVPRET